MKPKYIFLGAILYVSCLCDNSLLFAQGSWEQVRKADWEFGLKKIYFASEKKGFILGMHNELLVTSDGGESWSRFAFQDSLEENLKGFNKNICFFDSCNGLIVGHGFILKTADAGQNWTLVETNIDTLPLNNGYFCNMNNGTMVGDFGMIIHTEDGGKNWIRQNSGTDVFLYAVFFFDSLTGWCGGRNGMILHTKDGGKNWNQQDTHQGTIILDLIFLDENRGWAVGTGSTVLRTINGGLTWEKVNIETEQKYMLADIFFIDDQKGWIVGGNGTNGGNSIILHTNNGGNSWQFQRAPTLNHLTSVFFKDELHGWITGLYGTLLSTENGGVDWYLAVKATSNTLIAVSFVDKDHGWAIGTSTLIHTKDGGTTWVSCDTLEGNDIVFVDRHKGWFVHAGKGIYHTEDGGNSWQIQLSEKRLHRLSFSDPLHGWAMSSDSTGADIFHTQNGGKSWRHQFRLSSPSMQSIFFVDSLMGWAVGGSGIVYHTNDGGKSWKLQHDGIKGEYALYDVFFVNDSTGWAVGGLGIWHTANGGKSWGRQLCPLNWDESLQALHFTDENHGWAGSLGVMLYTEDGGKHWHRYYSQDFNFWCNDVYFTDCDHGWAVGSYGAVYKWSGNALAIADPKQEELPKHFELQQNYPNPFSPQVSLSGTKINYSLPTSAPVSIKILNLLGQTVYIFDEREQSPGNHSIIWNGNDSFGNILPNGIYFYQVRAGSEIRIGKMTLLR